MSKEKKEKSEVVLTAKQFADLEKGFDVLLEAFGHMPFELNEVLDDNENKALSEALKIFESKKAKPVR